MAGGIFISYRRDDAQHAAGRLVDRLAKTYAPDQLFLDVDAIEPGLDFVRVLSEKIAACDVMLAVIGPGWLESRDDRGQRRLDNPADFVRVEVEAAMQRDVRVIPILVDGAQMPRAEQLPTALQALPRRQTVRLAHESFGADADRLIDALAKVVAPKPAASFDRGVAPAPRSGNSRGTAAAPRSEVQAGDVQGRRVASNPLLFYAVMFLVVAIIAALLGFGGVAGTAMEGARILFWVAIVLFAIALIAGLIRRA